MKLKIRYENGYQTVNLSPEDTEQLWVSLSLEGDSFTQEQREEMIQDAWEKKFNRPDYNCWHTHDRHTGNSLARHHANDAVDADAEPLVKEVRDKHVYESREPVFSDPKEQYKDCCACIRAHMKPSYAEVVIAIHLEGMSLADYGAITGESANTVSHRLQRAEKKFREIFSKSSFLAISQGYHLEALASEIINGGHKDDATL